jgi:AcrR family transcriptional regulator
MDYAVQTGSVDGMVSTANLTPKGLATRERIVTKAADLVWASGVRATSLDDIRAGTATSKSQLFHYFPGGKSELISAIVVFRGEQVLDSQRPFLDELDTWDSWEGWRHAVLSHYGSQVHWGCPISALARELIGFDEERAQEAKAYMDRWRGYLYEGLGRMREAGTIRAFASPESLSLSTFASLHGGLLLSQVMQSIRPLESALDGALDLLHNAAATR